MPTPEQQSRWLEPGTLVTLYELDLTAIPSAYTGLAGQVWYFHEGVDPSAAEVRFRGHVYTGLPIRADGFEWTTSGTLPRPKLSVSNIGGVVSALLREFSDFVGATVIQRRTYSNFLDLGSNHGPPYQEFTPQIFVIERKVTETNSNCTFDLATGMDAEGILLPRRQVLATACSWIYRGAECTYAGVPVSDRLGHPFGKLYAATLADRPNTFSDGITQWNYSSIISASANFTPDDVGKGISGDGIPVSTTSPSVIELYTNGNQIWMNNIVFFGHPEGGVHFTIANRSRSILTVPTLTFDSSFIGVVVASDGLTKGTKISAIVSPHVVELDKKALVNGATSVNVGAIAGPNGGAIAAWNKNVVYDQYTAAYVPVTQPGGGIIRVYAVSKVNGNVGNVIYDEHFWMLDWCLKKQSDCESRFGLGSFLPYGGFPAANKLQ